MFYFVFISHVLYRSFLLVRERSTETVLLLVAAAAERARPSLLSKKISCRRFLFFDTTKYLRISFVHLILVNRSHALWKSIEKF